MNKHLITGLTVVILMALAGVALLLQPKKRDLNVEKRRPNVVIIFADDLGWADLPAYGNDIIEAPNTDQLAKEGLLFTRFYAQPVCSPSRAELLSGNYPARIGLTDHIPGHWRPYERVITPRTITSFPKDTPSLGHLMQERGYKTGYFGKWHLGERGAKPEGMGFDQWSVGFGFNHMADPTTPSTDVMNSDASKFIHDHADYPFLLMLSPTQPHIPLRAHAKDITHFEEKLNQAGKQIPVAEYAAMVLDFDRIVGHVMRALEEEGLTQDTLLIVMSDNGGLETTDLGIDDPVTSNHPLGGEKGTLYEGGIRIPFIVRWPGITQAGTTTSALASLMDIVATATFAGGDAVLDRDGMNLSSVFKRPDVVPDRTLYYHYPHYHHGRPASAILDQEWKLIQYFDDNSVELFNLQLDAGETTNVFAKHGKKGADMLGKLSAWQDEVKARIPVSNPDYIPDRAHEWWDIKSKKRVDPDHIRPLLMPKPFPSFDD